MGVGVGGGGGGGGKGHAVKSRIEFTFLASCRSFISFHTVPKRMDWRQYTRRWKLKKGSNER